MSLGAKITVHTDHENLIFNNLQTQYVLHWRCYVEDYSPILQYIEGPKNVITDTFSRLKRKDGESDNKDELFSPFVTICTELHNTSPKLVEHDFILWLKTNKWLILSIACPKAMISTISSCLRKVFLTYQTQLIMTALWIFSNENRTIE